MRREQDSVPPELPSASRIPTSSEFKFEWTVLTEIPCHFPFPKGNDRGFVLALRDAAQREMERLRKCVSCGHATQATSRFVHYPLSILPYFITRRPSALCLYLRSATPS